MFIRVFNLVVAAQALLLIGLIGQPAMSQNSTSNKSSDGLKVNLKKVKGTTSAQKKSMNTDNEDTNLADPYGESTSNSASNSSTSNSSPTSAKTKKYSQKSAVASNSSQSKLIPPSETATSGFHADFNLQRSNSLYKHDDETDRASYDFLALLNYRWNKNWSSGSKVMYSYDLKATEDSANKANKELGLFSINTKYHGFKGPKNVFYFTPGVVAGIPVNSAQKYATFKGSAGGTLKMAINPDYMFSKKFDFFTTLVATRNFHEFTTAEDNSMNTQYSFIEMADAKWSFTDSFYVAMNLSHYDTISYGSTRKEFYSHSQEIGYNINDTFAVAAGHSLGAPFMPVRKPNGDEFNFVLTDETQSTIYLGTSASF